MLSGSLTLESITISDMLMPDHAPGHPDHSVPDQPGKGVPFAFQFGYIIAVRAACTTSLAGLRPDIDALLPVRSLEIRVFKISVIMVMPRIYVATRRST